MDRTRRKALLDRLDAQLREEDQKEALAEVIKRIREDVRQIERVGDCLGAAFDTPPGPRAAPQVIAPGLARRKCSKTAAPAFLPAPPAT